MSSRSIVDLLFNYYVKEAMNRLQNNNEGIFVTELVQCPVKYHLRLRYPTRLLEIDLNEKVLIGKLLHQGLENVITRILDGTNTIEIEKSITLDIEGVKILGRADIVTENEVIEIKTTRNANNLPQEHHKLQAAIYAYALKKQQARLIYFVLNSEVKILEYTIPPATQKTIRQLVDDIKNIKKAAQEGRVPRFPWECSYCSFRTFCQFYKRGDRK